LNLQPSPYTSLFSATGAPTEEAFCDTKVALANKARKVRNQTQELARMIAHPLEHTQAMTRDIAKPLPHNKVVVQCLDKPLHSKTPKYEEKPPQYEEKQKKN
jgi:hypothetical protein